MTRTLDARGLSCPLPLIKARQALEELDAGQTLVVLATDPEAPLDLAAFAADGGHRFAQERDGAGWRLTLVKRERTDGRNRGQEP